MGPAISIVLLVCALALMLVVGGLVNYRGEHTTASVCAALGAVCLVLAAVLANYVFK